MGRIFYSIPRNARKWTVMRLLISLCLLLASSFPAWGKDPIRLFAGDPPVQSADYDHWIYDRSLEPGDVIEFADGEKFEFEREIDRGWTTSILRVRPLNPKSGEPKTIALRVPLHSGDYHGTPYSNYLNNGQAGYRELVAGNVPVPKQYRYARGQYVGVEQIGRHFRLDTMVLSPGILDPNLVQAAQKSLIPFLAKLAPFEHLGDLHMSQIVYDEQAKCWYLLDWDEVRARGFWSDVMRPEQKSWKRVLRQVFDDAAAAGFYPPDVIPRAREVVTKLEKILDRELNLAGRVAWLCGWPRIARLIGGTRK